MSDDRQDPPVSYDGSRIASQGLARGRLTINAAANALNYGLLLAVGLWYTPFMLSRLPEAVYGLIPLASSLTNYLTILTASVSGSVSRYVTADLSRGDLRAANATFNSFVFGGLKLTAALGLGIALFCLVLPVKVPPGYETQARWLFGAILGSFLVGVMGTCFEVAIWANNRFEIRSGIEILGLLLRNGTVVALFAFTRPDLWQVAVAAPLAGIVQFAAFVLVWRKLTPELRIDASAQTEGSKRAIYSAGSWMLVMQIGNQLMSSSDLLLVNRFFGPAENAKYGILILWTSILRSVFSAVGILLVPSLVALEAREDFRRLLDVLGKSVRIIGTLAAHATGTLCGLALPILTIWLRKSWVSEIAPITWLLLFPLCFEIAHVSLVSLLIAPERIRRMSLFALGNGIATVLLALLLLRTMPELGLYAVAIPVCVTTLGRHLLFHPVHSVSGLPGVPWWEFLRYALPTAVRFGATAAVAWGIGEWLRPTTFPQLLLAFAAVAVVVLPVSVAALPSPDREMLLRFVSRKASK